MQCLLRGQHPTWTQRSSGTVAVDSLSFCCGASCCGEGAPLAAAHGFVSANGLPGPRSSTCHSNKFSIQEQTPQQKFFSHLTKKRRHVYFAEDLPHHDNRLHRQHDHRSQMLTHLPSVDVQDRAPTVRHRRTVLDECTHVVPFIGTAIRECTQ